MKNQLDLIVAGVAFVVMGIITFYPLVFQTWMSFTDFGLKNLSGRLAPNYVGLDNYVRIAESELNIPNFEFLRLLFFNLWWAFSNVVIHVILGVAQPPEGSAQSARVISNGF